MQVHSLIFWGKILSGDPFDKTGILNAHQDVDRLRLRPTQQCFRNPIPQQVKASTATFIRYLERHGGQKPY